MKLIAKTLGSIIVFILYPFFWLLELVLLVIAVTFETIEKLIGEDE